MELSARSISNHNDFVRVFEASFSSSEGADAGATIAALVRDLLNAPESEDILPISLKRREQFVAGAVFSPLVYENSALVYLLSPVAVLPEVQGQGLGHELLNEGLDMIKARRASAVITYGDPKFYGQLGFVPITQAQAEAPYPLSMPIGWLGHMLGSNSFPRLLGKPTVVAAFANPAIW